MKKGLVSIIMPVYNGMPDIQFSIKSLLLQTYSNWECIVVNDGSTDYTGEYLDTLTDPRFIIHHLSENKGRGYARQRGLELAIGEFMAMLDADDIYSPKKLELQVNMMNNNPQIFLVGAGMCSFGKNVDFVRIRSTGDNAIKTYSKKEYLFPVAHGPSILRTKYAKQFSYNISLRLGEDIDFLKRYLDGKQFIILPSVLYYYSEFDSASLKKTRETYIYGLYKALKEFKLRLTCKLLCKIFLGYIIYPFIGMKRLLKRRGIEPTNEQLDEFNITINAIKDFY